MYNFVFYDLEGDGYVGCEKDLDNFQCPHIVGGENQRNVVDGRF